MGELVRSSISNVLDTFVSRDFCSVYSVTYFLFEIALIFISNKNQHVISH